MLDFFSPREPSSSDYSQEKNDASADKALKKQTIEEAFIKMRRVEITKDLIDRARTAAGPFWDGNDEQRKSA